MNYQLIDESIRMEKPAQCSTELYLLMRDCWHFYPNQRPTFTELAEDLQQILKISCEEEYLDLGLPALDTPPSSGDTTCALEQSATKFFQIQNQPLQFHNHHYDPDTNWSPDQGFGSGSASGSGYCPSEGVGEEFPLTYTSLGGVAHPPGTSTPNLVGATPTPDYQNTHHPQLNAQTSLPNGTFINYDDMDLPPPPTFLQTQTSLPVGDLPPTSIQYSLCNFGPPPPTHQYNNIGSGPHYPQMKIPKYIETQNGNLYGKIVKNVNKTDSQYTEDFDDYRERYSREYPTSQLWTTVT